MAPSVTDNAIARETIEHWQAAVNRLPETEREVYLLHSLSGLRFREIAENLEQPLGTILARMRRAVFKLKEALREDAWTDQ